MNILYAIQGVNPHIPPAAKGEKIVTELYRYMVDDKEILNRVNRIVHSTKRGQQNEIDYFLMAYLFKFDLIRDKAWDAMSTSRYRNLTVLNKFITDNWHLTDDELLIISKKVMTHTVPIVFDSFTLSEGITLLSAGSDGIPRMSSDMFSDRNIFAYLDERRFDEYKPTFDTIYRKHDQFMTYRLEVNY